VTTTLRIEHTVPDFESWKTMFDNDPLRREASGVRRYRILRAVDDPRYVMIDMEFDTRAEAEALLANLRTLWAGPAAAVSSNQRARVTDIVETREY